MLKISRSKRFIALGMTILLVLSCADEIDLDNGMNIDESLDVEEASLPLPGASSGSWTSLLARFYGGGAGCSAVLVPTGGSTTHWAITNQHCLPGSSQGYDSTDFHLATQSGTVVDVEMIYPHPLANWYLTGSNLGAGNPHGKVDVVLVRLASGVNVDADDRIMYFSRVNTAVSVRQESARKDGTWSWSRRTGVNITPDGTWIARTNLDAAVEGGDSGSPVWNDSEFQKSILLLEGLTTNTAGSVTDSSVFYEWVIDAIDCGPIDVNNVNWGRCSSSCPCNVGEGDCDNDSDCVSGLICAQDHGNRVGFPSDVDICLEPKRYASSSSGYCESIGGCQIYEGDCNSHAGCKGDLVCRPNVGAAIGLSNSVDVCDFPRIPEGVTSNGNKEQERISNAGNWCSAEHPCGLGEGDCDSSNHDTCRGYLKCKPNVGLDFGFTNASVDVCVHPSYL
jgi:hypothetical protein